MSFKITVEKAKQLQDIISAIAILTDEATLKLTPDSLNYHAMDRTTVAMLKINYPKTAFAEYNCPQETQVSFNVTEFAKLLKRAGKDDKTTLERGTDGKLHLTIEEHLTPEQQEKAMKPKIRRFHPPQLNVDNEPTPDCNLKFGTKATATVATLIQSIEDTEIVGDFLQITATPEKLVISSKGDLTDTDSTLEKGNPALLDLQTEAEATACYSILFAIEILKAGSTLSDIVSLEFNTNQPIKIDFVMQEGSVVYYLAPRIEGEVPAEAQ